MLLLQMNEETMLKTALEIGFSSAASINTDDICFVPKFRRYCEENLCGNYGTNYSCPPECGAVSEMEVRVKRFKRAIVLQTVSEIETFSDAERLKAIKKAHNLLTLEWSERTGVPGLMLGAGECCLCEPCTARQGLPCRFPDRKFSCLSAYCVFVRELAERCGMEYDCGVGRIAFFSMYCFERRVLQEKRA